MWLRSWESYKLNQVQEQVSYSDILILANSQMPRAEFIGIVNDFPNTPKGKTFMHGIFRFVS
jgi:hypothetical protein